MAIIRPAVKIAYTTLTLAALVSAPVGTYYAYQAYELARAPNPDMEATADNTGVLTEQGLEDQELQRKILIAIENMPQAARSCVDIDALVRKNRPKKKVKVAQAETTKTETAEAQKERSGGGLFDLLFGEPSKDGKYKSTYTEPRK